MSTPNHDATAAPAPPCVVSPPASPDPNQWFASEIQPHDGQLKAWLHGKFPVFQDEVSDIVQESYFRILKRQASRPIVSVKAFLFTTARNIAIDLLRIRRRAPLDQVGTLATAAVIDETPSVHEALSLREKYALLTQAIASLPPRRYEIIVLHKFQDLNQREVAEKLGLSVRTVENQVQAAIRHCEQYLRERGVTRLND